LAGACWEWELQGPKGALVALPLPKADKHCASARGLSLGKDGPEIPSRDFWIGFFPSTVATVFSFTTRFLFPASWRLSSGTPAAWAHSAVLWTHSLSCPYLSQLPIPLHALNAVSLFLWLLRWRIPRQIPAS